MVAHATLDVAIQKKNSAIKTIDITNGVIFNVYNGTSVFKVLVVNLSFHTIFNKTF